MNCLELFLDGKDFPAKRGSGRAEVFKKILISVIFIRNQIFLILKKNILIRFCFTRFIVAFPSLLICLKMQMPQIWHRKFKFQKLSVEKVKFSGFSDEKSIFWTKNANFSDKIITRQLDSIK